VNAGEKISDRYEIVRELGRGGAGVTYLARDLATGRDVVAKLLHLGLLGDWKAVELFEREAAILKDLHNERIPAYVDFFPTELEGAPRFVLVREYVDGVSLQARVEGGWRATEEQICAIGARLARIVGYIHSVRPPVIHRDINPRNVMVREDGEVFLVDFGGVQDAIRVSTGAGYTVVGTPGYTPMEQFVGRATVRSDLYAVAATLLFLLTHRNPADLPVKEMKVDFSSVIEISSRGLSRLLVNWLEPDETKRTLGVEPAIALLEGRIPAPAITAQGVPGNAEQEGEAARPEPSNHPPSGSLIVRTEHRGVVGFLVPDAGGSRGMPVFGYLVFCWVIFGGFWRQASRSEERRVGKEC
jgi:eukaryotic-like serine/threonine-protein kinase